MPRAYIEMILVMKMLYLVLNQAAGDWKRPPREWFKAKTQFAVVFGERFIIQ
nr:hypothetical protein [Brucella sp. 2280]